LKGEALYEGNSGDARISRIANRTREGRANDMF
jgi:hypothetical protein